MESKIRIGIVDDHPLYRAGVVFALECEPDFEVVAQGGSAEEAIMIAREVTPDVLLLDLGMPGGGLTAIERIGQRWPRVKTLVLTVEDDEEQVCSALSGGAQGYLLKGASSTELVEIIRLVDRGERYVPPNFAARILMNFARSNARTETPSRPWPDFSPREEQILAMIVREMTNKKIGDVLGLSEKTVKHYVTGIFQKLNVRTREEAGSLALARITAMRRTSS